MKITLIVHCDGATPHSDCKAAYVVEAPTVNTHTLPSVALRIAQQEGGWDVRPVATAKGTQVRAFCPRCADALLAMTADQWKDDI